MSSPLRDRFGIICKLSYYTDEELSMIVKRTAKVINTEITNDAALEIAKRSRKTPRVANRLLKRVSDFALVEKDGKIDLNALVKNFNGGPVGIESISASIGEEVTTLEDVVEPFLLQEGFIKRTSRGRVATEKTYEHLKINYMSELNLLDN